MNEAHSVRIPMYPDAVKLVKATEDEQKKGKNFPYRSLVGCLQYLMSGSRPDLATALRSLSKVLEKIGVVHWQAAKRVFRYVKGTSEMGLHYDLNEARKYEKLQIEVHADASFASDPEDLKSVSGFTVLCNGQLIPAKSWKQGILAESTCEAELIAVNEGLHDAIWLEQLVDELGLPREKTILFCDSISAVALMKHAGKHRRTKQLRIKDLKIREYVVEREVGISSVATQANVADTMTKPLPAEAFRQLRDTLGVQEVGAGATSAEDRLM
ncbi:putative reverse transcriptase/ribonuclease H (RT) (RT-RH) [CHAIN 4] [Phytophthora infestans]|uniref:Putative reverse transcriptase/ribonuclease H (RT) (RT-RH) [CHAIN 4] n=1 Tax=Phytophthora infestans TaxID=4787 RepID=A0A8S9UJG8_PHYIN|nr:putative reverse transcriptase/ribonuclease H (RT) (RT-RH) [CHAIN 4] [Phytophthora infestans]